MAQSGLASATNIRRGVCYHIGYPNCGASQNSLLIPVMPRWSVDIIRKRAEHLGEVDAPDEQAAIKRAAEVFDIPPERQNRIRARETYRSIGLTRS